MRYFDVQNSAYKSYNLSVFMKSQKYVILMVVMMSEGEYNFVLL